MNNLKNEQINTGAASILVELDKGVICIKHGTSNQILFDGNTVKSGTWRKMFESIVSIIKENEINVIQN